MKNEELKTSEELRVNSEEWKKIINYSLFILHYSLFPVVLSLFAESE